MAAAPYAFLVSLLNTMDQVQIHSRLSTCFDSFQFQSLRQMVDFLLDFVENHSDAAVGDNTGGEALLNRIAVLAQMAEDVIEVEAADRILHGSTEESLSFFHALEAIIDAMDSMIKEEVMEMKEEKRFADRPHISAMAPPSSSSSSTAKTTVVVGFNGYLERMLDELTGHHPGRRILPIVGMGGIGKTTLAKSVYEHSLTLYHFDVRVWVTVSQRFSVEDILSQVLSCLGESTGGALVNDEEIGVNVHKLLFRRRYLIVFDDVWSVEAWEKIKLFFPENNNGSRIVVTTRQGEVVDYFRSSALVVDFLNKNDGWELFCGKAFAGEGCPHELEEVGRKIVEKCKGLPLAISVVGGLLSKSPRTRQYWEKMANDFKSLVLENSEEGNKALSILYLSYKHLPACLKPCFLHLGLFPGDHRIDPSFLVKLWVAEGIIKPKKCQSLEQDAESYIKELVDRNLLLVGGLTLDKKVKFYRVHDLVRELCIRIGKKEQFYCVQKNIDRWRQSIVDERTERESLTSSEWPSVRTPLIFHGQREVPFKSRLFRVFLVDDGTHSLTHPFQVVNLRFFLQKYRLRAATWELPSSISLCWTLQYLILDTASWVILPSKIWQMPQLRHIEAVQGMLLPNPPLDDNTFALPNLQTLKRVKNLNFNEEVCERIPNIKELAVEFDLNERGGCFSCLNKLESLHYRITGGGLVHGLKLPSSLKKLYLENCHFVQSDMAMIASMPRLESLWMIGNNRRVNTTWDCVEGKFVFISLKHLYISECVALENWVADSSNFPVLETLELWNVKSLKEIPSSFGEIPTLELLELYGCRKSAIISAINIQQEQESLGNLDFQLKLKLKFNRWSGAQKSWRAKIQKLGITSQNIHVTDPYLDHCSFTVV